MPRILVIEDDASILRGIADNLAFEEHEVLTASDGETGYRLIREKHPDLVILDLMLPKMSGYEVCRKARGEGVTTPIVILTARGEEADRILGLDLGADDYVSKPFSVRELMARVRAHLRRMQASEEASGWFPRLPRQSLYIHSTDGREPASRTRLCKFAQPPRDGTLDAMLNLTPVELLTDRDGRPYFLWDCDLTLEQFQDRLRDPDPDIRAYFLAKLMRQARPDDVFRFISLADVESAWPRLTRYLGRSRPFWNWLLETWRTQARETR